MRKLTAAISAAILSVLFSLPALGAGFYEQGTAPAGGYPSSPSFVHTGTNSLTATDNASGNYTADLVRWRDAYINRNIIGNGGYVIGYKNVTGDNTGRLSGYTFGAAGGTDNGILNYLNGEKVLSRSCTDPRSSGAVGDNVTDSTAAIQAALDAGGTVCVPFSGSGIYVTAPLTITKDNTALVLSDNVTLRFSSVGDNTAGITVSGNDVKIKGGKLKGPTADNTYVANESGIYISGSSGTPFTRNKIEGVEITGFGAYGVKASYSHDTLITKSYIHHVGYTGIGIFSSNYTSASLNLVDNVSPGTASNAYGIFWTDTAGEAVPMYGGAFNNTIKNIPLWEGLDTHGGIGIKFEGNDIFNTKIGITVTRGANNTPPKNNIVSGNTMDSNGAYQAHYGINVSGNLSSCLALGNIVQGNTVINYGTGSMAYTGGIFVSDARGTIVKGNRIDRPVGRGITLDQNASETVIVGNIIDNVLAGSASVEAGINLFELNATDNGIISGNVINSGSFFGIYNAVANAYDQIGNNIQTTNGTKIAAAHLTKGRFEAKGSKSFDASTVPANDYISTTVTVTGAAVGDTALLIPPCDTRALSLVAVVLSQDTVTANISNGLSSGFSNAACNGTWAAIVKRMNPN